MGCVSGCQVTYTRLRAESAVGEDCFRYPELSCAKFVKKNVAALAIEMEVVPAAKSGCQRAWSAYNKCMQNIQPKRLRGTNAPQQPQDAGASRGMIDQLNNF